MWDILLPWVVRMGWFGGLWSNWKKILLETDTAGIKAWYILALRGATLRG